METEATATEFQSLLEARGVTRRSFMKLCGAIAAAAGLSQLAAPKVAQAVEDSVIGAASGKLCPAIWIEGASCTGCTESFAQVDTPDPATVVLELLSLNYSETLSAAAGYSMEEAKAQTIEKFKGEYILVYEGAVLEKWGGHALRVANEPGTKHLLEAAANAKYVVAFGSCAVNGGWMGAEPNSSDALGVAKFLKKNNVSTPVVNIPGCPGNPEHLVAILVDVLLVGKVPELTDDGKPKQIFGQTVHDNCERRGHFENGEFVRKFGSPEEAKGYCLYAMGCRGPQTYSNCGVTLWNHGRSWCVQAGSPCIGCCEADPDDPSQNWVQVNTPFYERHRDLRIGSIAFQPTTLAAGVTALAAIALGIHGYGMKKTGRTDGGADFEDMRMWDRQHPDDSIGKYETSVWEQWYKAHHPDKPYNPGSSNAADVQDTVVASVGDESALGIAAAGAVTAVAADEDDGTLGWRNGTIGAGQGVEPFEEGYSELWKDTFNGGSQHSANSTGADLSDADAGKASGWHIGTAGGDGVIDAAEVVDANIGWRSGTCGVGQGVEPFEDGFTYLWKETFNRGMTHVMNGESADLTDEDSGKVSGWRAGTCLADLIDGLADSASDEASEAVSGWRAASIGAEGLGGSVANTADELFEALNTGALSHAKGSDADLSIEDVDKVTGWRAASLGAEEATADSIAEAADVAQDAEADIAIPAEALFKKGMAHWLGDSAADDFSYEPVKAVERQISTNPDDSISAEALFNEGMTHWLDSIAEKLKGGDE